MDSENRVINERKKKLRKKRTKRIVLTIFFLAVIIFAVYLYRFYMQNQRLPWTAEQQKNEQQNNMKTATVRESVYRTSIDVSGFVEAYDTQKVQIRTTGAITGVYVKEGDRVTRGQLLAMVSDLDQQYEVSSIKKQLEISKMNGTTSARDIELLEMRLESAEKKLDNTKAYADFDGVVISVSIREGDYYSAGSTAITIIDNSKLKTTVEIDEIDIKMVKIGAKVSITSDSSPGETIEGRISYIPMVGRYTNQGMGVMVVEIVIDNPPETLKPGFSFGGTIAVSNEQKMLIIPQASVSSKNGQSTVTRLNDDGTMETLIVQVRYLGENLYQVVGGDLKDGDTLVYGRKTDLLSMSFGTSLSSEMTGGDDY